MNVQEVLSMHCMRMREANPGTMIILQPITQAHKINLDQTHMPLSSSVCRAWKELNAMLTTVVVGSDGEARQLQLMNMLLIWICHHYNNIHPEGDHEGWRVQRWQWWWWNSQGCGRCRWLEYLWKRPLDSLTVQLKYSESQVVWAYQYQSQYHKSQSLGRGPAGINQILPL